MVLFLRAFYTFPISSAILFTLSNTPVRIILTIKKLLYS